MIRWGINGGYFYWIIGTYMIFHCAFDNHTAAYDINKYITRPRYRLYIDEKDCVLLSSEMS